MEYLEELELKLHHSDAEDALPIDFSIEDTEDNVCWVWGMTPDSVEFECDHPDHCIEYDDDETVGECLICGATCEWHRETSSDDGYAINERVPHHWEKSTNPGGIIKKILNEMEKENE